MRPGVAGVVGAWVLVAASVAVHAQESGAVQPVDRRSAEQISAQAKTMLEEARKTPAGIMAVTLEKYPGHLTMLTVRTKSGGAEVHADWNDFFFPVDGEASVVTGGTVVDPKESSPGETRGVRLEGATTTTPMHKGDVIHISPGVPHQTVVAPGKTFTYYVIKVAAPKP